MIEVTGKSLLRPSFFLGKQSHTVSQLQVNTTQPASSRASSRYGTRSDSKLPMQSRSTMVSNLFDSVISRIMFMFT